MNITKKIFFFLAIICVHKPSSAQFTSVAGNITQSTAGNVGIGILTPTAPLSLLEVKNGSVLYDGTIGITPISGVGTRMMWIPAKGAFRAGNITATQWDDANIGSNSFACGKDTKASGLYAFASGTNTSATGPYSFASGIGTIASANFTFASGSSTTASASGSSSFGTLTIASGISSAVFGNRSVAQSYNSFVLGAYNYNPGTYNTLSWVATDPLFVIGNGTSATATNNALTVLKNGNVLINKVTQVNTNYILDVNGKIRASEIVVNTTGADFVFEKNYKLIPLNLLEQKINEEKHLPGMASATDMQENGVGLAELNKSLLQKMEELTLYIIELNKRIEFLEQKLNNK